MILHGDGEDLGMFNEMSAPNLGDRRAAGTDGLLALLLVRLNLVKKAYCVRREVWARAGGFGLTGLVVEVVEVINHQLHNLRIVARIVRVFLVDRLELDGADLALLLQVTLCLVRSPNDRTNLEPGLGH